MSQFGQELTPNDAPALPLWIDGHAYLMMADGFLPVIDAKGKTVRKVPLYGEEAVRIAATSAADARAAWQTMPGEARERCFRELHELLARYRGHLCKLLEDEAGLTHQAAEDELEQALVALAGRLSECHAGSGVAAVAADQQAVLAGPLACAAEALAAGWAVVLKTSPKAPSALFALAELFTRAGFPAGLVNCVHGDEAAMRALAGSAQIGALAFAGSAALAERVGQLAVAANKPYAGGVYAGPSGKALIAAWRPLLGYPE